MKNDVFYMAYIWGSFHVFNFSILFSRSSRSLLLKVLSLDQQYQRILRVCWKCRFWGPILPPHPTPTPESETAFSQDPYVICIHTNV